MKTAEKLGGRVVTVTVPTPYDVGDVNMYLYEDEGRLVLIDAAVDTDEAWDLFLDALKTHGWTLSDLSQIWLTHHHADHVGLVNRIAAQVPVPAYVHPKALPRLRRDPAFLERRIRFFERLYREMGCGEAGERQVARLEEARRKNSHLAVRADLLPVREGDVLGGCEVWEVPGHAPDHVIFLDRWRKWLFAGDHLIAHISSNAFIEPDESGELLPVLVQYASSLEKCKAFDAEPAFSGHGAVIDDHRRLIDKRLRRIEEKGQRVAERIAAGSDTAYEIAVDLYGDKIHKVFGPVMSEIIGLLGYLEHRGRVARQMRANGVWKYKTL